MNYGSEIQPKNSRQPLVQGQKVALSQQTNPAAVSIATAVRYNKLLKQRQGINSSNNSQHDFFRYKRFVRALESEDYKRQSDKRPDVLPAIEDDEGAQKIFVMMIQNQLVLPVRKLKTKEAKDRGIKVTKTSPALEVIHKAVLQGDVYYMWNFTPANPYLWIYSILGLVAVFGVILFPLWPIWMRKCVWYLSTGMLALIGVFFGIAIIRLIIYIVTWVALPQQFWLFPNLFADCGVIESFKPLYEWKDPSKGGKHKHKDDKTKGAITEVKTNTAETAAGTTTSSSVSDATTGTSSVLSKKRIATVVDLDDSDN
ncbi:hypothetical protein FOA43_003359 [Brettanomyces nanus]|uniref:Translocation protein SEC62 n=1 Tax=Eeniella nana TaxID=13502 RepID=A0A875S4X8_EENNA|nr:uncharacterized protein FOA43_003359 [Brettanomyces nanus]QPG75973.1 hypothetical protein FOA43_003359 [Brettanomyces nanus]